MLDEVEAPVNQSLKVACILDRFSYDCFKYECDLLYLSKKTWRNQLKNYNPDFLLVESFWEGKDKSWSGESAKLTPLSSESELVELLKYCKERNIKTVFWNKEDPPNYYLFINSAERFDCIFSTDRKIVTDYKLDIVHENIFSLPFAAQPAIHNPIRKADKIEEKIVFAGAWYRGRHLLRQKEMEVVLQGALGKDLIIYDRNYGTENNDLKFPEKYQSYINGSLSYSQMVEAYKQNKIFLNVNTVRDSETMFSRRVYEVLACGTNIISSYSAGIEKQFKNIVPIVTSEEETKEIIDRLRVDNQLSEQLSVLGLREVYSKHLYKHRLHFILDKIGLGHKKFEEKKSTVISFVNTLEEYFSVKKNFERQRIENRSLLVFTSLTIENDSPQISIVTESKEQLEVLNRLNNNYLALMAPDSYYDENYLLDMSHAAIYSKAEIVAKGTYYSFNGSTLSKDVKAKEYTYDEIENCSMNTLFINLNRVKDTEVKLIKDGILKLSINAVYEALRQMKLKCFSANRFGYVKYSAADARKQDNSLEFDSEILTEVCVANSKFTQKAIDSKSYFRFLKKDLFSEAYPGVEQLMKIAIGDNPAEKRLLIYGAGVHTKKVLGMLDRSVFNIIGIVDKNTALQGMKISAITIYSPSDIQALNPEFIYISSHAFESEIYDELKGLEEQGINFIRLYGAYPNYIEDIQREFTMQDYSPRKVDDFRQ